MDKKEMYKRYRESLQRAGINFQADDNNYVIKVWVGGRAIEVFSSKNSWRDQSKNVKGNGVARLVTYIGEQVDLAIREERYMNEKANAIAVMMVKDEFQKLSFIRRLFGKFAFQSLLKELDK